MVDDVPTTFHFGNTVYEPGNFGDRFYGRVSLRKALAKSMNVATVSLAEAVGYRRVVELAKRAGLNDGLRATPALALGAYEVTPLEMAGAYTVFANEGTYVKPALIAEIRSGNGSMLFRAEPEQRPVLDPKGRIPHAESVGRSGAKRYRGGSSCKGPPSAGGGQDRHLPRRVVCRIHIQSDLCRLGGIR